MQIDPIAAALRRDAELLLAEAPPLDTAGAWHRVRMSRAARLQQVLDHCAWGLRLGVVVLLVGALASAPRTALAVLPALILVGWLTTGIAAPLRRLP